MEWLRGDFHAHSNLSDGLLTPDRLIEEAEREALDFFAITDHNTWAYPHFAHSEHVLVLAGVEVTLPYGHFNVFGVDPSEPEWMTGLGPPSPVDRDPSQQQGLSRPLIEGIGASDLRASINHPLLFPWEWVDSDTPLELLDYLEVWNDPTWPENRLANPAALDMWTRWLQAGHRVTAVGGSDFHDPDKTTRYDGLTVDGHRVGFPRTYVLAEACTAEAILDAVDRRRAYVTMGPVVELVVLGPDGEAGIGDDLGSSAEQVDVEAIARGPERLGVELVLDGVVVARSSGSGPGLSHRIALEDKPTGWLRIDVRDQTGDVIAFTNPVYFGPEPDTPPSTYGVFTDVSEALSLQGHNDKADND
ncbi:hypothetical protein BH23ACT5_BH23ACT5_00070 [soil metagenome]